ncbi:MAG: DUF2809 domain-containing protein [Bacteroides sp.]|nr:DUF2809 domain-containing protein [Bacteroides sp.]MCM1550904.1 DUF2809 domain-containing protein [Clostridium sp.]
MKLSDKSKMRILYAGLTLLLLIVEIIIALYVHDDFIRPYVGDGLVVIVIYFFIRSWMPERIRLLPLYVFLFAALVEVMQYFRLLELLGLEDSRFLRILLGATFDFKDIICYGAGCLILGIWEWIRYKKQRRTNQ